MCAKRCVVLCIHILKASIHGGSVVGVKTLPVLTGHGAKFHYRCEKCATNVIDTSGTVARFQLLCLDIVDG